MKTLIIKLTDEQQAELRKVMGISAAEPCEYLGVKIEKAGGNGTIVAYNAPPTGTASGSVVALV
jgi:hypothetical protein